MHLLSDALIYSSKLVGPYKYKVYFSDALCCESSILMLPA